MVTALPISLLSRIEYCGVLALALHGGLSRFLVLDFTPPTNGSGVSEVEEEEPGRMGEDVPLVVELGDGGS